MIKGGQESILLSGGLRGEHRRISGEQILDSQIQVTGHTVGGDLDIGASLLDGNKTEAVMPMFHHIESATAHMAMVIDKPDPDGPAHSAWGDELEAAESRTRRFNQDFQGLPKGPERFDF